MKDGKHVILCVDDDQHVLDTLRPVLESSGYVMVEATSAESGLRKYRETRPDPIIADPMIEEIDSGASLVTELKAAGNTAPVCMLSSVGESFNASSDYAAFGLSGVVQKPIDARQLLTGRKGALH